MKLKVLPWDLTVCKTVSTEGIDLSAGFFFIGKTDEEVSLVCRTEDTPANTLAREDGWRGFRVAGVLDFSLTGILAKLSAVLAEQGIGIFAVSTYNTDYLFVREDSFERAVQALKAAGHELAG